MQQLDMLYFSPYLFENIFLGFQQNQGDSDETVDTSKEPMDVELEVPEGEGVNPKLQHVVKRNMSESFCVRIPKNVNFALG